MRHMSKQKSNREIKQVKANYKKTVIATVSFVIIAIAGAAYIFLGQDFGKVALSVEAKEQVRIGEPFDIALILENGLDQEITETVMFLSLPDGVIFTDRRGDLRRATEEEVIPAGAFRREIFTVVITEFSENKSFQIEARHLPPLLGRAITTSQEFAVKVQPLLDLKIEAPDQIISGEKFEWTFSYGNDTESVWNIDFEIQIPEELKTDLPARRIKIDAGERKSETFSATAIMEEGRKFTIKAIARGHIGDKKYVLSDASAEIMVGSSPLSFRISRVQGQMGALRLGEEVVYTLSFTNNSNTVLQNVLAKASLSGTMFDLNTIKTDGIVDTSARTITWGMANVPGLAELSPGESRLLNFSINIQNAYPIRRLSDKDFTVGINARVSSPTIPRALNVLETVNIASMTQKIAGKTAVTVKALYRDAASKIINEGVFPPVVDQPTEYSIHWEARSYSTHMSEIEISAELPLGVDFVRQVKVEAGELLFEPESRKVTWKIPKLLATTGVLNEPFIAIFQIKAIPSLEHVGGYMPILGGTNITAMDDFTGDIFSAIYEELTTTELRSDNTVRAGEGIVRQF